MKIQHNINKNRVRFYGISAGGVFKQGNTIYIKIGRLAEFGLCGEVNAVCLESGDPSYFDEDDFVEPLNDATLVTNA